MRAQNSSVVSPGDDGAAAHHVAERAGNAARGAGERVPHGAVAALALVADDIALAEAFDADGWGALIGRSTVLFSAGAGCGCQGLVKIREEAFAWRAGDVTGLASPAAMGMLTARPKIGAGLAGEQGPAKAVDHANGQGWNSSRHWSGMMALEKPTGET
ncbi:MAG: hypothetical protein R3D67_11955 [Hyphomicrobiaceae bacterium]